MATSLYATLHHPHTPQHQTPRRKVQLQEFQHKTKMLLTASDREYFHTAIAEYQMYRQIDKFVACLKSVLDTPAKLDLLQDVRNYIGKSDLAQYDHLAPYHKMAHPWKLNSQGTIPRPTASTSKRAQYVPHTPQRTPRRKVPGNQAGHVEKMSVDPALLRAVTIVKDEDELLGFSIRGGWEHGLGIFVSDVEEGTSAERAGLLPGDNIIEVNSISFESVASDSAVKVLTGSNRLKMTVRRIGKVPGFKSAKEKTSWYDVVQNRMVDGDMEDQGVIHRPAGRSFGDSAQKRINLTSNQRRSQYLGFNIRGGAEYGLGVYVSRVDPGGVAEQKGLKTGDQILEVNGQSLEDVTHVGTVDLFKGHRQLILSVRDVGKYPVFKEIYAEYRWIDTSTGAISKTRSTGHIRSIPVANPDSDEDEIIQGTFRSVPRETRVESYVQTDDSNSDGPFPENIDAVDFPEVGVQTDAEELKDHHLHPRLKTQHNFNYEDHSVLLPHESDVMFREMPTDIEVVKLDPRNRSVREKDDGRPVLAMRAMEMETERSHPGLAEERRPDRIPSRDEPPKVKDSKKAGTWTFKDLLFGSKSKGKSATQGVSRPRNRKPLTDLHFGLRRVKEEAAPRAGEVFEHGVGSQLNLKDETQSNSIHGMLDDRARRLLSKDEINALVRHASRYDKEADLDALLIPTLAILDTAEKRSLLTEIRLIIHPADLKHYDRVVAGLEASLDELHPQPVAEVNAITPPLAPAPPPTQEEITLFHSTSKEPREALKNSTSPQRTPKEQSEKFSRIRLKSKTSSSSRDSFKLQSFAEGDEQEPEDPLQMQAARHYTEVEGRRGSSKLYKAVVNGKIMGNELPDVTITTNQPELPYATSERTGNVYSSNPPTSPVRYGGGRNPQPAGLSHDSDSSHYYSEIGDYTTKSGKDNKINGNRSSSGVGSMSSSTNMTSSPAKSATSTSPPSPTSTERSGPIYAQVNKPSRTDNELAYIGYIDSDSLYPSYESDDTKRHGMVLDSPVPTPPPPPAFGDPTDDEISYSPGSEGYIMYKHPAERSKGGGDDSQSETYAEAKVALGFLQDALRDDGRKRDGRVLESSARMTFDGPPSPSSSEDSGRSGAYEVNPEDDLSPASENLRMFPPRFVAPPPPVSPPPVHSEDDDDKVSVKSDKLWVTHDYLKKKTSSSSPANSSVRNPSATVNFKEPSDSSSGIFKRWPPDTVSNKHDNDNRKNEARLQHIRAVLSKAHPSLGLAVSGGSDSKTQPQVKIQKIFPGGAAALEGSLKPGMRVLSIDGQSVDKATHMEAVMLIRRAFSNKQQPAMEVVAQPKTS